MEGIDDKLHLLYSIVQAQSRQSWSYKADNPYTPPFKPIWKSLHGKVFERFWKTMSFLKKIKVTMQPGFQKSAVGWLIMRSEMRFIKDSCQQWNLFMPPWYRKHFTSTCALVSSVVWSIFLYALLMYDKLPLKDLEVI